MALDDGATLSKMYSFDLKAPLTPPNIIMKPFFIGLALPNTTLVSPRTTITATSGLLNQNLQPHLVLAGLNGPVKGPAILHSTDLLPVDEHLVDAKPVAPSGSALNSYHSRFRHDQHGISPTPGVTWVVLSL